MKFSGGGRESSKLGIVAPFLPFDSFSLYNDMASKVVGRKMLFQLRC